MIEVELKFQLPVEVAVQLPQRLASLASVQLLGYTDQVDRYYDTLQFACFRQAVFMRIRNATCLEIKYHEHADPFHLHSTESVFPLLAASPQIQEMNTLCTRFIPAWKQAETVEDAIAINSLSEFVCIEKHRAQYRNEDVVLAIDHVEGLGNFLEVETSCEDEANFAQAAARLQDAFSTLGLPALREVRLGYVELWLQQHLPRVYRLGKYQE